MRALPPRTPLEAAGRRRFLLTGWPWRSLCYLLTGPPLALAAAVPLAVLATPWFVLADGEEQWQLGGLVLLSLLGAALIAAGGPLVALPMAALERWRLRLVDTRPAVSPHRTPAPGLWPWLRTRYTEAATWRELGYLVLLATVAPLLCLAVVLVGILAGGLVTSPLLVAVDGGPITVGLGEVTTPGEAVPYALAGLAFLPAVLYLVAVLAGAYAVMARALLHRRDRDELEARLVEVARSRARLVDAFEAERRRIERDLHDGAQRRLVNLSLQLGLARLDVPPGSPAAESVADAHEQAKQLMAELRELIRGIHPKVLTDHGLAAALRDLADDAAVPVRVTADLSGRLPSHLEHTAYFVVAEALTNVAKHSGATAASVTARQRDGVLTVEVGDNGRGGAEPSAGTGLTGLADRVAAAEGRMLLSSPAGGPTLLRVELPCSPSEPPSG